jgi:DNA-binding PadR family transcriptional regulator
VGKKQFALLLLAHRYNWLTTSKAQQALGTGVYKTLQAALNKLVGKGYLATAKLHGRLHYNLTEAGQAYCKVFVARLCPKCLSVELIRDLYS